MRAIVSRRYGELALEEIDAPEPGPEHVLVRVRAAGVNPLDYHELRGTPRFARVVLGLRRPKHARRGVDVAGTVEAVGAEVTSIGPGDNVYGIGRGSFGELVRATENVLAPKPAQLSFEEAAAIPVAAVTALEAVRERGGLRPGQSVLVNGASGGVGTFAVQIVKALGGEVTGVCSTRNLELVRSLGADRVLDYTDGHFASAGRHDLVVNCAEGRSLADLRRVLAPGGKIVLVTGSLAQMAASATRRDVVGFIADVTRERLVFLSGLVEAGHLRPVIERTYELEHTAEAIRHVESHHTRGKVVVVP
jgi:NADPH:quinone reductase-like Zn-dependent oxidoreductase